MCKFVMSARLSEQIFSARKKLNLYKFTKHQCHAKNAKSQLFANLAPECFSKFIEQMSSFDKSAIITPF